MSALRYLAKRTKAVMHALSCYATSLLRPISSHGKHGIFPCKMSSQAEYLQVPLGASPISWTQQVCAITSCMHQLKHAEHALVCTGIYYQHSEWQPLAGCMRFTLTWHLAESAARNLVKLPPEPCERAQWISTQSHLCRPEERGELYTPLPSRNRSYLVAADDSSSSSGSSSDSSSDSDSDSSSSDSSSSSSSDSDEEAPQAKQPLPPPPGLPANGSSRRSVSKPTSTDLVDSQTQMKRREKKGCTFWHQVEKESAMHLAILRTHEPVCVCVGVWLTTLGLCQLLPSGCPQALSRGLFAEQS